MTNRIHGIRQCGYSELCSQTENREISVFLTQRNGVCSTLHFTACYKTRYHASIFRNNATILQGNELPNSREHTRQMGWDYEYDAAACS